MIFWDSSALARAHMPGEPGFERARNLLKARKKFAASVLIRHETVSAFVRRFHEDRVALKKLLGLLDDHLEVFDLAPIEDAHLDLALTLIRECRLRAADALHLGCALTLSRETGRREFRFVTCDAEQGAAARARGLRLIEPA